MTRLDPDRLTAGWRGPLLAALVAFLACLPGLAAMPPLDRAESRFAQITSQMVETGDLTEARFQDRRAHDVSPLAHWLQAASAAGLKATETRAIWPYRLPSILAAMLAAAACAWGAAAFWGGQRGTVAGVVLASSLLLSTMGFMATADALLCATVMLAMAALSRIYADARVGRPPRTRHRLVFWAALAASVLLKGLVGPLIVGLTLATLAIWDRKAAWIGRLGWVWGLLLMLAAAGPWALAVTVATDGEFWSGAMAQLWRALGGGGRFLGLPGYHLALSPMLLFPATLLMVAAAVSAWKRRDETGIRFALAWLVPAWILFELTPAKLPHFVLPLYPAIAWLIAAALTQVLSRTALIGGIVLSALAAIAWCVASVWLLGQYGDPSDQIWVSIAIVCLLAGVFIGGWFMLNREVITALMITCTLGVLAHAALSAGLVPHLKRLWPSSTVVRTMNRADLNPRQGLVPGPVAVAGYRAPSLVFLLGAETELGDAEAAALAVAEGRPAIVEEKATEAFLRALAAQGLKAAPLATLRGYDYVRGDPISLTIYRPGPPRSARP